MTFTVSLVAHRHALWSASKVAKGHVKERRGRREGPRTTWSVENNDGTEIALVRLDKPGCLEHTNQPATTVQQGTVVLVLEGVLGNGSQRYPAGTVACFTPGEMLDLHNANRKKKCWYAILWFVQPQPVESS